MPKESAMFNAEDAVVIYSHTTGQKLSAEELRLPHDFAWGTTTAAYQNENGAYQEGKGKSGLR